MNFPTHITAGRVGVSFLLLVGLVVFLFWITRSSREELEVGQVYLRAGLPDSAMVTEILATAPNEAGYLMVTILAYDRLVRIDQVDKCAEIRQNYDAALDIIPIPVHLPDHTDCFSYRIRFDMPLAGSATPIPLTVAVVHPDEDRHLLQEPDQ